MFWLVLLSVFSCAEIAREAKLWTEIEGDDEIPGSYHFLEDDGTKIFLPEEFERYSISAYQKVLDSLLDGESYEFEVNRLNKLKDDKGELYIYFDEMSRSTYTVKTTEYLSISKDEAQMLLGMIRSTMESSKKKLPLEVEKISAKYSGSPKKFVFKALYKITNNKENYEWYNASYIITSNLKTVYIHLVTSFNPNFDPYILKTIL